MTKHRDLITLNGKQYDALSGTYVGLDEHGSAQRDRSKPSQSSPRDSLRTLETKTTFQPVVPVTTTTAMQRAVAKKLLTASRTARGHTSGSLGHSSGNWQAHKPQQAKTLMRHVVRAPSATAKVGIKLQPPIIPIEVPAGILASDDAHSTARSGLQPVAVPGNRYRSRRALTIGRSDAISRFVRSTNASHVNTDGTNANKSFHSAKNTTTLAAATATAANTVMPIGSTSTPTTADILATAPAFNPSLSAIKQSHATHQQKTDKAIANSVKRNNSRSHTETIQDMRRPHSAVRPYQKAQQTAGQTTPLTTTSPQQALSQASKRPSDNHAEYDIFEQALALATSHQQKPPKQAFLRAVRRRKHTRRILNIAAAASVFVALSGFVIYQNKSSIQLQLASAKAGFTVVQPTYKPNGFAMDRLTYSPGNAAAWYTAKASANGESTNSNAATTKFSKTFSVIQKKSNWDSQTLLESFVATSNQSYKGYQANGRIVYVYGDGRATWVNGGMWYQIQAGDSLSDEQLVKVAASL